MSNNQPGNQLARGSIIGSLTLAAGYLVQYLFQVSVSRTMDADTAGMLFIAFAFVLMVSVLTRLGLDKTGLKTSSIYFVDGRLDSIREIALLLTLLTGCSSALIAVLIIFGDNLLSHFISLPGNDLAMTIIYASIPLIALSFIFSGILRGMRLVGQSGLIQLLIPYTVAIIFIWSAWYLNTDTRLAGALAFCAGFGASALLAIYFILRATTACTAPVFSHYQDATRGAPFMLWSSLVLFAISSGDVIILSYFVPANEVAYYFAASRTAMLISVGLVGINSIVVPLIASAYKEKDMEHLGQVARMGARLSLCIAVFCIGFLFQAGESVLSVFGSEYRNSFILLLILLTGQLVNSAVGAVAFIMFMCGQEKGAARILTVVIVIMLALYMIVIPLFGIIGAALVTAFGLAIWNIGMMRNLHKTLGVITCADNLPRCILFLSAVGVIAYVVNMVGVPTLYPALLYILLTPVVLWKYLLHDEDRDALMSVVG